MSYEDYGCSNYGVAPRENSGLGGRAVAAPSLVSKKTQLERRIDLAELSATRALEELEELERYDADDWPNDTVLAFTYCYPNSENEYSYLAYKIKGLWYLSGRRGDHMTWDELVDFWVRGTVTSMYVAT